jgi:hypothetical protein
MAFANCSRTLVVLALSIASGLCLAQTRAAAGAAPAPLASTQRPPIASVLAQKDAEIGQLNLLVERLRTQINALREAQAAERMRFDNLNSLYQQRGQQLQAKEAEISRGSEQLQAKDADVARGNEQILEKNHLIAAKAREIEAARLLVATRDQGLKEARERLGEAHQQLDQLRKTNANLELTAVALHTAVEDHQHRFWLGVALAAVVALAVGSALTRRLWPKKVVEKLIESVVQSAVVSVRLQPLVQRTRGLNPSVATPSFGVRARLIPIRSHVRAGQQPLVQQVSIATSGGDHE